MQFTKNTRKGKIISLGLIIKCLIAISIVILGVAFINQINLPSPNKKIEKILPNENFKTIK